LVLSALGERFPLLAKLCAAGASQGPVFRKALAKVRPRLTTEIIPRREQAKGFVVLPKRWIVERTLAWLNRCRRLAKDFANRTRHALAFVHLASIRLMLRKLCTPS
jgi:transposase